jgi:hydrogenase nickel incorporation protein HypA/HybF
MPYDEVSQMHEYSIVQNLLDLCEQNATANNCTKITKVVVKVGRLSNVEPQLLQSAFDTFKDETIASCAQLVIIDQKVVVICNVCSTESILEVNQYSCPSCGIYDVRIIDGQDLLLMSLEMDE